jgi:Fic family protein
MTTIFNPQNGAGKNRAGTYMQQPTGYRAFIPQPLPPVNPPLDLTLERSRLLSDATLALGRLDAATQLIPNPDLFVGMYVNREAVLSSQIEGTQASLTDVLVFEIEGESEFPIDVAEVINYVTAMNYGLSRLATLPLSLHLIREIHRQLMQGVRGQNRDPGEFRRTQNWIGPGGCTLNTATFVPPPPQLLMDHLGALENFMHDDTCPPLIRAGLAHAQFETIHPFLDGNGRIGRLLITFMLCQEGVLHRPLLYLSYYLRRYRAEYYDRLQAVRLNGRWEEWLDFFLRGVAETADEAWRTAQSILQLQQRNRELLQARKASGNTLRVHELLWRFPIVTVPFLRRELKLTFQGANGIVQRLEELGILQESTGYRRNRRFVYTDYLRLFNDTPDSDDAPDENPPNS